MSTAQNGQSVQQTLQQTIPTATLQQQLHPNLAVTQQQMQMGMQLHQVYKTLIYNILLDFN